MIIINKSGYLKYKNFKLKCALGKSGIGNKKTEGGDPGAVIAQASDRNVARRSRPDKMAPGKLPRKGTRGRPQSS